MPVLHATKWKNRLLFLFAPDNNNRFYFIEHLDSPGSGIFGRHGLWGGHAGIGQTINRFILSDHQNYGLLFITTIH